MLFFEFLSLLATFDLLLGSGRASCASRLCRPHRRTSIFVDFDDVTSGVCAAGEAFQTFRSSRDDRVGVGTRLDHVTLPHLLVEERVESALARAQRIDLTHDREYRKSSGSGGRRLPRAGPSLRRRRRELGDAEAEPDEPAP